MTLTNRLTFFFLLMQAFVLIGFSTVLYVLAYNHLHQQVEERLGTVLNTLSGAIETEPQGLEWEPRDREQSLKFSTFEDHVVWLVSDNQGQIVAQSRGAHTERFIAEASTSNPQTDAQDKDIRWQIGSWEAGRHWVHSDFAFPNHAESLTPPSDNKEAKYRSLSVTAGVSLVPVQTTLHRLAYSLVGLSVVVWSVSFAVSRMLSRRALLPVQRIAVAAEGIHCGDLTQRLPPLKTKDELDRLTHAFNAMLDRLQEAFERQRRFTGEASHQLRTPLTAILGQVEVALRRERPSAEYRQVLETVHRRAKGLARMVDSLLYLARADAEAQLPAFEQLNLATWLPLQLETWSEHPRSNDLVCRGTSSEPCLVVVPPELMAELLNILLDNACKYSEPGTPVTVSIRRSAAAVSVDVEDQGCGIEDDKLANLFLPFFRSSQARSLSPEGCGLGLSIAKRLSEVFGGELTVVSQPSRGSCFTLHLPRGGRNDDTAP
ncbi:ATP-binding protein [Bremerella cremea]|uniref:ATP-binding protein n=1 Tax=Bremerella cremea TaxID=1031537 RepID=UPI001313DE7E|nr:ATP-binding protein [Bremerella cremea]